VTFSDNVDLDAAVARNQAVIAAYATSRDRPDFPFWPMQFDNITIRLLGSGDFSAEAKQQAATELATAARDGALSIAIGPPLPPEHAAQAHNRVDAVPVPAPASCWTSATDLFAGDQPITEDDLRDLTPKQRQLLQPHFLAGATPRGGARASQG